MQKGLHQKLYNLELVLIGLPEALMFGVNIKTEWQRAAINLRVIQHGGTNGVLRALDYKFSLELRDEGQHFEHQFTHWRIGIKIETADMYGYGIRTTNFHEFAKILSGSSDTADLFRKNCIYTTGADEIKEILKLRTVSIAAADTTFLDQDVIDSILFAAHTGKLCRQVTTKVLLLLKATVLDLCRLVNTDPAINRTAMNLCHMLLKNQLQPVREQTEIWFSYENNVKGFGFEMIWSKPTMKGSLLSAFTSRT